MSAPFLTYLTVFKARIGVCNLIVDLTGLAHQPLPVLTRKLTARLAETELLAVERSNDAVMTYLRDKRLITGNLRKTGRYKDYRFCGADEMSLKVCGRDGEVVPAIPVFATDIWLADPTMPSTIGVPTPENASECIELAFQLRLLTKAKNTWTSAGQLVSALRARAETPDGGRANPFLLGPEGIALLRQALAEDGIMLVEVARTVASLGPRVTRDELAGHFDEITDRAVARCAAIGVRREDLREAREFRTLIRKTAAKARRRAETSRQGGNGPGSSAGPGVLEHRLAPRLEWLTDFGYLTKADLPRNGFEYRVTAAMEPFVALIDDQLERRGDWADEVASQEWRRLARWEDVRQGFALGEPERAYAAAYMALKRKIGPAPLREVAFFASLCLANRSVADVRNGIVEFVGTTQDASLSGGRYSRDPENVYMNDRLLAELA